MPERAALPRFAEPPSRLNSDGLARTVGVEVEFGGISARRAADALAAEFRAGLVQEDTHALLVTGTPLGDLLVEIDARYAHPQRHPGTRWGMLGNAWAARLATAAEYVVPRELVTRPLPFGRLPLVDRAVEILRAAGAREVGPAAYGLHFNVEPPRLDAETIASILKAFVLLNDWLRRESKPRRISHRIGFGRRFPAAYVRRILAEDYRPDIDELTEDYLAANPTRNRDLDLLPLLLHFDEERVRARLPREKIGSRAVLHYRLPTARVSEPGWSIAAEWNRWVAVERLAANPLRLSRLAAAYFEPPRSPRRWAETSARLAFEE
jgi:hypothetical protein